MKKFLTLSALLFGVVTMSIPLFVGAQAAPGGSDFVALAPIHGLTDTSSVTSVINSQNLASFFNNLYKFCIGLAAALAVIMIIWGGLEISTQDSISKQGAGKEKIQNAIYGLLLVLSPVLVFSIINPAILNLSLNLRALDTAPIQPGVGNGEVSRTVVNDATTGCSETGVPGFLQTVTCPSDSAASMWTSSYCSGRVSGGDCLEQNSSGECTKKVQYCEYNSGSIVFVDIGNRFSRTFNFQPINASAAATFQQFKAGCDKSGGVLCTTGLSRAESLSCSSYGGFTTSIPATAAGSCYNTPVYCFSKADADTANSLSSLNPLNSTNYYSCNMQFTPQPLQ